MRRKLSAVMSAVVLATCAQPSAAQDATTATPTPSRPTAAPDDSLVLLSVDVRTMPDQVTRSADPPAPQWRTTFGSERRSDPVKAKPSTSVDADIVLLQGVTDVPTLRRWFPAGQWRLVVSRQIHATSADPSENATVVDRAPVPTTAVAVRLRRGLRVTGQDHLLELSDASGRGPAAVTAAGTAVRVFIEGRQTWAVSVLLPEDCGSDCPGRIALDRWHQDREREEIRRVTGGRFAPAAAGSVGCGSYGLRLDPAPPPPRQPYVAARLTPLLGCAALVSVAK
jgi:hypothetical protein